MASGYRSVPGSASRLFLMVVYRSEWGDNRARDMLLDRGHTVEVCCPARGDALPGSPGGYAGVIVGGGLDGLLDDGRPPYVDALVELTRACLEQDVAFLGFCFGAQVLVAAGEGRVLMRPDGRGAYGYRPVRPVNAEGEKVLSGLRSAYHLHFHGFEAPPGSVSLAAGELFPSSAFRLGANAYGFQFHPEIRADQIETVLSHLGPQALARPGVDPVPRHLRDAGSHDGEVHAWLERFMDGWIDPEAGQCSAAAGWRIGMPKPLKRHSERGGAARCIRNAALVPSPTNSEVDYECLFDRGYTNNVYILYSKTHICKPLIHGGLTWRLTEGFSV